MPLPVFGTGIVPSQNPLGDELNALTRRAFIPKMVVQIYNASPAIAALMANYQSASGGVSSVSLPVQGLPFVNTQTTSYSGSFAQPQTQQGAFLAQHNLKMMVTPIPFLGMEGALQMDHAIIPLVEARMNDSTNSGMDFLGTALYNNTTDNTNIIGFAGAIDDGTNLNTYGSIARNANTWWKAKVYAAGSVNPTRALVMQYITGVVKNCGELPTCGFMGPGTWQLLAQDFLGVENFRVTPGTGFDKEPDGARSAFQALSVAGVPIYLDPYCPEGLLYLTNTNYLNLYIHESASFSFTGFYSLVPNNQIGYQGAVLTILELVHAKPKATARVGGFNSLTI